jgi:hypothetical protein
MVIRIVIKTKTSVDGETSEDFSSKLDMPGTSDFDVSFDNGCLVVYGINEASDSTSGVVIKRDIVVEVIFDRSLTKKIAEVSKQLPKLP